MSGLHRSSSAFPAISPGFTILLLLSQVYLWASPFDFFFCLPTYISGLHHLSSSAFPPISLGFTILLLLLLSKLYLWASPFFFFCLPTYISGLHHSSSSAFPPISLGFTILLLLLRSPAISLGFTILLLLPSHLYLWASPLFFFCLPSYISGLHHSSSSPAFPPISLGFTILGEFFAYVTVFVLSNPTIEVVTFCLHGWCMLEVIFVACIHLSRTWISGSFESMRWNAYVQGLDLSLYSHPKEFWGNGVRSHINSKRQNLSTGSSKKGWTCYAASRRTANPTYYWLSYCGPQIWNKIATATCLMQHLGFNPHLRNFFPVAGIFPLE